mmetsp:Transcript_28350/g.91735  ORF Transcript_28350/g.91735 Transcript_28350/m.91735 type:complete len:209 (-) Transcript_28350:1472-2098(-)
MVQNGWEKTSKGAKEVAKSINESTASASETMTEAGEKIKEAVVVDTAARKRIAELEEENRLLRERLNQAASSGSNTPSAKSDGSRRASFRFDEDAKSNTPRGDGCQEGESTDIRSFAAESFSTAKSPNVPECSIRVRMTDGTVIEKSFPSSTKLKKVVESVLPSDDLREEWTLMLPYPRKIFGDEDLDKTLLEASLAPAATMNVTKRR